MGLSYVVLQILVDQVCATDTRCKHRDIKRASTFPAGGV